VELEAFRRPQWSPLPHEGTVGVDGKVIVVEDRLQLAILRFAEHATIHEHPGETDTLWTEGSTMLTLMVERASPAPQPRSTERA
jgi:hypothetical protein